MTGPRFPHPLTLLVLCILVAGALTWVLPAGEYQRREDPATGRNVVVPGTYAPVEATPVGPFQALVGCFATNSSFRTVHLAVGSTMVKSASLPGRIAPFFGYSP